VEDRSTVTTGVDDDDGQRRRQERFAEFVAAHRPEFVRVALRVLRDPAEAEDVVQDTLANLWRQPEAPEDLAAYAFRAVRLNALKRRERRRAHVSLDEAPDAPAKRAAELPVDPLAMERAISRLPPPQQAVVRMRYYVGLSLAEIARALSISSNTAASRCRYALAALRRALRHHK
jgi:RNA polymerase sigma factor (sigma-70 family)